MAWKISILQLPWNQCVTLKNSIKVTQVINWHSPIYRNGTIMNRYKTNRSGSMLKFGNYIYSAKHVCVCSAGVLVRILGNPKQIHQNHWNRKVFKHWIETTQAHAHNNQSTLSFSDACGLYLYISIQTTQTNEADNLFRSTSDC